MFDLLISVWFDASANVYRSTNVNPYKLIGENQKQT